MIFKIVESKDFQSLRRSITERIDFDEVEISPDMLSGSIPGGGAYVPSVSDDPLDPFGKIKDDADDDYGEKFKYDPTMSTNADMKPDDDMDPSDDLPGRVKRKGDKKDGDGDDKGDEEGDDGEDGKGREDGDEEDEDGDDEGDEEGDDGDGDDDDDDWDDDDDDGDGGDDDDEDDDDYDDDSDEDDDPDEDNNNDRMTKQKRKKQKNNIPTIARVDGKYYHIGKDGKPDAEVDINNIPAKFKKRKR